MRKTNIFSTETIYFGTVWFKILKHYIMNSIDLMQDGAMKWLIFKIDFSDNGWRKKIVFDI